MISKHSIERDPPHNTATQIVTGNLNRRCSHAKDVSLTPVCAWSLSNCQSIGQHEQSETHRPVCLNAVERRRSSTFGPTNRNTNKLELVTNVKQSIWKH